MQVDYSGLDVQVVMECTGAHLTSTALQPYFDKGVRKVVVSAPVKDGAPNTLNVVVGCNEVRRLPPAARRLPPCRARCLSVAVQSRGSRGCRGVRGAGSRGCPLRRAAGKLPCESHCRHVCPGPPSRLSCTMHLVHNQSVLSCLRCN